MKWTFIIYFRRGTLFCKMSRDGFGDIKGALNIMPCSSCKNTASSDYSYCCAVSRGSGVVKCGAIISSCKDCYKKRALHDCEKVSAMYKAWGQENAGRYGIMIFNRTGIPRYVVLRRTENSWDFPIMYLDSADVQEAFTWPLLVELRAHETK